MQIQSVSRMDKRSERNLVGVHDGLVQIVEFAFELFDDKVTRLPGAKMVITDGLRTEAEQLINVEAGRSWTMNSRHLPNDQGEAEAIDFALIWKNKLVQELPVYERVYIACFRPAAHFMGYPINWGGYWKTRDGPHIELAE